jgi:hypothetical protein
VRSDVRDGADPLLAPLLNPSGDIPAEHYIETLLIEHAQPIIKSVIDKTVFRFGAGVQSGSNIQDIQEAEDLVSQVQVRLVSTLRRLSSRENDAPIRSFSSYVASVSYNVCNSYLREKWPQRYRLKKRACYILSNDARFAVWEDVTAGKICGLVEWGPQEKSPAPDWRVHELQNHSRPLVAASTDASGRDVASVLHTILGQAGAPVGIDDLVTVAASALGAIDQTADQPFSVEGRRQSEALPGYGPEQSGGVEERLRLKSLWSEIAQLPRSQRVALLLALKDEQGDSLLRFLSAENIVTMHQISAALEIAMGDLVAIWPDLPLGDERIAAMLGAGRKKVAAFRQSARRRLARRVEHQGN